MSFFASHISNTSLRYHVVNAWQWKSALFVLKESGGTITCPPCMTVKMVATARVLHDGEKETCFPLKTSLLWCGMFR